MKNTLQTRHSVIKTSVQLLAIFLTTVVLCISSVHAAQVGIGIGRTNEYTGSKHYKIIPMASFSVDTRLGELSSEQIGLKLDIVEGRKLNTGPILRFNAGRDNDMKDDVVATLPKVGGTAEAGWFINSGIPLKVLGIPSSAIANGSLKATTDLQDVHGGSTVTGSVGLMFPVNETLRIITSASINWSDKNYQRTFFGVDAQAASDSGLNEFSPGGGLESTGLTLVVAKQLRPKWSFTSITSITKLAGDAQDSPIVKRGSDTQLFLGLIFGYTF